jgi:hypothetical protein
MRSTCTSLSEPASPETRVHMHLWTGFDLGAGNLSEGNSRNRAHPVRTHLRVPQASGPYSTATSGGANLRQGGCAQTPAPTQRGQMVCRVGNSAGSQGMHGHMGGGIPSGNAPE